MNEQIGNWVNEHCIGEAEHVYSNGLDYMFCTMRDGWIAIINTTGGIWHTVIQAKNRSKALDYIAFIEPVTVQVNIM